LAKIEALLYNCFTVNNLAEQESYKVAIVGWGMVGENVGKLLMSRQFPLDGDPRILATPRSAGRSVRLGDSEITVEVASEASYEGLDFVFNTAPSGFSAEHAEAIHAQGPIVIDSSSDWRKDPRVPLIIPEVNPEAVNDMEIGIVAKPNCTTTIGAIALHHLDEKARLKRLTVSTYQSTSGQGKPGIRAHHAQVLEMVNRVDELIYGQINPYPEPTVFPAITAFNAAPLAGTFEGDNDHTTEELKFRNETRKIFNRTQEQLRIDVTCARIDTFNGHALSILAEFEEEITAEQAHEIFSDAPGIALHEREDVPQPIYVVGTDPVHVGRVRQSEGAGKRGLNFWATADNTLIGAALNGVNIAELLIR
jgi:aspartate-semialdehyde dehydrogenase